MAIARTRQLLYVLCLFAGIVTVVVGAVFGASDDSLIRNGKFLELVASHRPAEWIVSQSGQVVYEVFVDRDSAHDYPTVRMVGSAEDGRTLLNQKDIPGAPQRNKTLKLSARYKGQDVVKRSGAENYLRVEFWKIGDGGTLASAGSTRYIHAPEGSTDWTSLATEFVVPDETDVLWVSLNLKNTNGTVWWGDVALNVVDNDADAVRGEIKGVPPLTFDLQQADFDVPSLEEMRRRIPESHPRLFTRPEDLEQLRDKHNQSLITNIIWGNIRRGALTLGILDLPAEPPNARPGGVLDIVPWREGVSIATDVLNRLHTLGFAYLISGDELYGKPGVDLLLHVAAWDPYGTSGRAINDEISMRLLYGMSRAYDWLYPLLTDDERDFVKNVMRERGNDVYLTMRQIKFEEALLNNHLVRSMGFLGEAAIAFIGELPEAEVWFDYIVSLLILKYPAFGGDEGGWSQGVSYWQSYVSWLLEFMDALKIATDVDLYKKPFFHNTGYFKLYAHPPKSKIGAFGDHSDGPPNAGSAQIMGTLAHAFRNPAYQWYASTITGTGRTPILPMNNFIGYVRAPESMDDMVDPVIPEGFPQSRVFHDVGWALMNVDMDDWDNNVHIKFKSSPYGSHNHSHAEQNSFMIEAYGSPLAISSGYYPWYGSPHHATWTWESKSKNTILVDGAGQGTGNIRANGHIETTVFGSQFDYVVGDATPSYMGRIDKFLRHLLFVKPNLVVIYDDIDSGRPGTNYEWLLHSPDEMVLFPEDSQLRVPAKTAEMWVSFVAPKNPEFRLTDQFTVRPEDRDAHKPDQWHFSAETLSDTGKGKFLTVLVPRPIARAGEPAPAVSAIETVNGTGFAVALNDRTYEMAFRENLDAPLVFSGYDVDATAFARWNGDAEEGLIVIGGQSVVNDQEERFWADRPVDLAATEYFDDGQVRLELQITDGVNATIELAMDREPTYVTVNGQPSSGWSYEDGVFRMRFNG